ncbi:MAG: sulfite exporter TauE/SafE family protein [Deltaproteobacteria bacterium]
MEIDLAQLFSIIWLGILTSISPCPLATNIAATTYIGRQINSPFATVLAATAYTIGRTLCYVVIAAAIISGLFSIPGVSMFLQAHINKVLGPVLFITGFFILELVPLNLPSVGLNQELFKRIGDNGIPGALALGFL